MEKMLYEFSIILWRLRLPERHELPRVWTWSNIQPKKSMIEAYAVEHSAKLPYLPAGKG